MTNKNPLVGWGVIGILFFLGVIILSPQCAKENKQSKQETSIAFDSAGFKKELKNYGKVLFKTGFVQEYEASPEDNYHHLKVVMNDKWFLLPEIEKERYVKQISEIYANLRIKFGVANKAENFPKVIFEDAYGIELAKYDTWGLKIEK